MSAAIQLSTSAARKGCSLIVNYNRIGRPPLPSNGYPQVCDSLYILKTHLANFERLVLLPRYYAMGRLSNTGDGFQSGYRSLSVCGNGPLVAKSLCRREGKSCGFTAIPSSSSDIGMYVTSNFFPVFSSYALNTSLNDYRFVSSQTPSEAERQVGRYLILRSNGKGTVLQLFGWKVCQHIGNKSSNIGP